ncbi:peptidase C39 family protein [Candidatus Woesearchaeota archaeon]|nr:peptidase C39 family protein [Candidatus Woesearchaeota archaeon]
MIPYYKQQTDYTCGAACMRMALTALGINKTEKQLAKLMGSAPKVGTWYKEFPALAEKYTLNYVVNRNSTLADLKRLSKTYIVIIAYYLPEEKCGHYAIVRKIDQRIHLIDPEYGPKHLLPVRTFLQRWHGHKDKKRRWMFGMRK